MKILALSQDISLLNIIDYILYKDYKIVKSTSFENLEVEFNSFDLLIIDLPYWENNPSIEEALRSYPNIPLVILTEDKSSSLLASLKSDFHIKAVLKEPLSKKDLKESVKEVLKKKKQKKDKDRTDDKFEYNSSSPLNELVNNTETVFFRVDNPEEKKIEFISDNYKGFISPGSINSLKDISDEQEAITITPSSPDYSTTYRIKDSNRIVKESGKGFFNAYKALDCIEGTITDYTDEHAKESLMIFINELLAAENFNLKTEDFIRKIIHSFAQRFDKSHLQLSIIFLNKDYFANDFSAAGFSVSSDILSEKKLGEVILFSHSHNLDDALKSVSQAIGGLILVNYSTQQSSEKTYSESARLKQELALIGTQLAQAEAAFQDKAKSFDNLNELFNSAMKDFKSLSSRFNKAVIQFETNADGKFISANENYYRAASSGKEYLVGKHFDDIFENTNWQNFQFEFFNNTNQEISLKQKNKEGKPFYFNFNVTREEGDNGYKFIFYGRDKTDAKSSEVELSKQISEYNIKVNELIDAKRANELLWEEINTLKEEIKNKDAEILHVKEQLGQANKDRKEEEIFEEIEQSGRENEEYKLDVPEAEIRFEEEVHQKIEEAKEEFEETHEQIKEEIKEEEGSENEELFKNLKGIDFKTGLANAYDNINTYNEILVNFVNDYIDFIKDIRERYLVNDNEYVKAKLITLAEESHYIGAEDLEKSAKLFHDKLNDNKVTNFDFELSVLNVHLNFTLDSIRKYKEDFALIEQEQKSSPSEDVISAETAAEVQSHEVFLPEVIIEEEIIEENKTPDDVTSELQHEEKVIDHSFNSLLKELKNSLQSSEDISAIREKLFEIKFQNNDFGKIEKLEAVESNIELGNNNEAIKMLDELING